MKNKLYKLSEAQKRILVTLILNPNSNMFNLAVYAIIHGTPDLDKLTAAISSTVRKHDTFSIRLVKENDNILEYFSKEEDIMISYSDFSDSSNPNSDLKAWMDKDIRIEMPLFNSPLYHFMVYKLNDQLYGFYLKIHHLIADGWSFRIFMSDINDYYSLNDRPEVMRYREFVESEKNYFESEKYKIDKEFWEKHLEGIPNMEDSITVGKEGKRIGYVIERERNEQINQFCLEHRITKNIFFLSVYMFHMYKTLGENLVVGVPVLGRNNRREREVIGMFVSSLPFHFKLSQDDTILENIKRISRKMGECYKHQRYPYSHMIKDIHEKEGKSPSLYNICVNYYNTEVTSHFAEYKVDYDEVYCGSQEYDFQMVIKEWGNQNELQINYDYKIALYQDSEIENVNKSINCIVNEILTSSDKMLKDISELSKEEEKRIISDFNNTKAQYKGNPSVVDMFKEQVKLSLNKTAIEDNGKQITYQILDQKSDLLASYLVEIGVQKNEIVAIYLQHSIETILCILAIMKAGAAFLPVDVQYPKERIDFIFEDAQIKKVFTNIENNKLNGVNREIIHVNEFSFDLEKHVPFQYDIKGNDLVYIIYTSGSTGKPKGVMIEHQNLFNYVSWAKSYYITKEQEILPLYSSLAFDLTMTSVFLPIVSGGTIIIYHDDEDEYVLNRIIQDNKCTIIKLTPAHLQLLNAQDNSCLRVEKLIVGGENLLTETARNTYQSFKGNIKIYNEYGPTEATIGCMIYEYNPADEGYSVPIGVPIANTQIYVLHKNLKPVMLNEIGEIYIGGNSVASGYLNLEEITKERFVENPYCKGERMYKTGDLAHFNKNYQIEYITRCDTQVKLNGFRIELSEIQNRAEKFDNVKQAVAMVRTLNESSIIWLCYTSDMIIDESELQRYLSDYLPYYMQPHLYTRIDKMPLTINGKVDYCALQNIELNFIQEDNGQEQMTKELEVLQEAVVELLHGKEITSSSNFYFIGGDSIRAIQLVSKLADKGWSIKVKDILNNPVLLDMSMCMNKKVSTLASEVKENTLICLSAIYKRFLDEQYRNIDYYCQSIRIQLNERVSLDILEQIILELVKKHNSLRISYDKDKKMFYYNQLSVSDTKINEYDINMDNAKEQMNEVEKEIKGLINLSSGCLIKSCVYHLGSNQDIWMLAIHHVAVDGISWNVILNDIDKALSNKTDIEYAITPEKTSYAQWSERMEKRFQAEKPEMNYWINILNYGKELFLAKGIREQSEIKYQSAILAKEETYKILEDVSEAYHAKVDEILLSALFITLNQLSQEKDFLIELENHGRDFSDSQVDITNTVGWFTSIYPFRLKSNDDSYDGIVKSVKEEYQNVPDDGRFYGYMRANLPFDNRRYIRFNYMGQLSWDYQNFKVHLADMQTNMDDKNPFMCYLEMNLIIVDGQLNILLKYDENDMKNDRVSEIISSYIMSLKKLISVSDSNTGIRFSPSDFKDAGITQNDINKLFF